MQLRYLAIPHFRNLRGAELTFAIHLEGLATCDGEDKSVQASARPSTLLSGGTQ